jgi:hypothetical protein
VAVADDDHRGKAEPATAFDDRSAALDLHDILLELAALFLLGSAAGAAAITAAAAPAAATLAAASAAALAATPAAALALRSAAITAAALISARHN